MRDHSTPTSTPRRPASTPVLWHTAVRRSGCDAEGWTLFWSDGVAKDWTERYSDLSIALARLATLQRCGESDWELGFTHTADEFAQQAAEFFAATTR